MKKIKYPSVNEVIKFNTLVLNLIKVKKADQPKILSISKITKTIYSTEDFEGDLYDKAANLMQMLVRSHAFASGNRRTAFITTKQFVLENSGKFKIPDDSSNAKAMIGIREGYYSLKEIKEWIKNGKIREFKR